MAQPQSHRGASTEKKRGDRGKIMEAIKGLQKEFITSVLTSKIKSNRKDIKERRQGKLVCIRK